MTSVLFEGLPTYPDAGRAWAVVEKYNVNAFYTGTGKGKARVDGN